MWYCLSQRFTDIIKKKNNNSNTYRELWFWSPSFSKSCETASKQNSVPIRARLPLRLRFDFKLHVVILRDSILQLSRIFSHDSFHERLHRHDSTHESPSSIMISCEGLSLHGYLLTVSCYVDFHHPLMIYSSWETIAIFTVFFFISLMAIMRISFVTQNSHFGSLWLSCQRPSSPQMRREIWNIDIGSSIGPGCSSRNYFVIDPNYF